MIVSISNSSIVQESGVDDPSPMPIMEYTSTFVPTSPVVEEKVVESLVIPRVILRPKPADTSRRKRYGTHKKETTPPLKDDPTGSASMLSDYVPPRPTDEPKVKLEKMQRINW